MIHFFQLDFSTENEIEFCSFIYFALLIINLKVIQKVLLGLSKLTKVQVFYIYKLINIIMVNKNKNFIFAAF